MKLFKPLKTQLRENVQWTWNSTHQDAFDENKEELTKTPVLEYFNAKSEHVIQADTSLRGLGIVLLQDDRPVIYLSRTLTPAEEENIGAFLETDKPRTKSPKTAVNFIQNR